MKQNDILVIIVAIVVAALVAFGVSKVVFSKPNSRSQSVQVVAPISSDFPAPDKTFFNDKSLNPTVIVTIGQGETPDPFGSSSNQGQ